MPTSLRYYILQILQWTGLAIVLTALSFSNFFISFGTFWLAGVWLLSLVNGYYSGENIRDRFREFIKDKALWVPSFIFLLPLIGLLWTEDFKFASWDLRMKIPILFMPLLLGTLPNLPSKWLEFLLRYFIFSLVVAVSLCLAVYTGIWKRDVFNIRDISVFISHIRFSMLLVFGIALIVHRWLLRGRFVFICSVIVAYFLVFLWILESITGFVLIVTWVTVLILYHSIHSGRNIIRLGIPLLFISMILGGFLYLKECYEDYFSVAPLDVASLELSTPRGNPYEHYVENRQVENGHYIMTYICWQELKEEWEKKSDLEFDSLDVKGNEVKWTLIRYLTSMGERKDADGMKRLNEEDINNIERGIPSYSYYSKSGIRRRLDKVFFELDNYRNGGSPNGHSVFQRFEFWEVGTSIFCENFILGVGTGDLKNSFKEAYIVSGTRLEVKNRLRAHNQYLTFFITYGVVGGLIFLSLFFYPVFADRNLRKNMLYLGFTLICVMSFLSEDTLETQVGVTFYIFLHSFLIRFYQRQDVFSDR